MRSQTIYKINSWYWKLNQAFFTDCNRLARKAMAKKVLGF
jgi:hypothetical protein